RSGQGSRIEAGKRVEGIAFDVAALHCRIDEAQVEVGIVAHHNSAGAAILLYCPADCLEQVCHHHQLGFGHAVRAVEINAGEIQGGLFNVGPRSEEHTSELQSRENI